MMKKLFLTFILVAFAATSAMAEGVAKKPSFREFETNGFWDNWEVSVGFGTGTAFSNGSNVGPRCKRWGYEGTVSLTKWIHPVVGIRGQLEGGVFKNFSPKNEHMEWPFLFAHIDVLANFSNWIGGYREDRVYYAVPFAGMGYMATNFTNSSKKANHRGADQSFAFAYGLLNKFRVAKQVDIDLELKGFFAPSSLSPAQLDGAYMFGLTATLGVTYRFNKRNWDRKVEPLCTAEELRAYQNAAKESKEALDAAEAENARLAKQLDDARAEVLAAQAKAAETQDCATCAGVTVLFDIESSTLSSKERTRLDVMVENIKSGDKEQTYEIVGYADRQTGTAEYNAKLSEKRAKSVYNYLLKKGINKEQLTYKGVGDTEAPYSAQKANRAAIIK